MLFRRGTCPWKFSILRAGCNHDGARGHLLILRRTRPTLNAPELANQASKYLERKPCAELNLSRRCRGFGDGSELWSIHEAIRRSQIRVVERIERFGANLKLDLLGD